MSHAHRNELAKKLRQLHVPGQPVIFTNCYDVATAAIALSNPDTRAIATASFGIAATKGLKDEELGVEDNLACVREIARVADQAGIPLSADLQDGYRDLAGNIQRCIEAGAVGCNLEDLSGATDELYGFDDAVARIRTARAAAAAMGVADFCINARTDVVARGGSLADAIARGTAYLAAGAVTCYVWGGPGGRGISRLEVEQLVRAFAGMVNVKMNLRPGFLTARELAGLGVARISVGPELYRKAMAAEVCSDDLSVADISSNVLQSGSCGTLSAYRVAVPSELATAPNSELSSGPDRFVHAVHRPSPSEDGRSPTYASTCERALDKCHTLVMKRDRVRPEAGSGTRSGTRIARNPSQLKWMVAKRSRPRSRISRQPSQVTSTLCEFLRCFDRALPDCMTAAISDFSYSSLIADEA
nr:2-methylisocitrate lyase [Quercus suber]